MTWSSRIQQLTGDHVLMVQGYTLCRQTGIIASSIVVAHVLPLEQVGVVELLMFCGYLMTFFWSDSFLKGYLSRKDAQDPATAPSTFLLFCFLTGLLSMSVLFAARHFLVPLLTDRPELPGLALFGLYQAFVVPLWLAPFLGGLRSHNVILLSAFVLIGPTFAIWIGHSSLPGLEGILIGLLSYALVGFIWILTQVRFIRDLKLRKLFLMLWPVTWPLILYAVSSAIARSLDAWLVARYFNESIFAVFRYGAREFPLVVALAGGLSIIMIPRLIQNDALPELKNRSTRLMNRCYPIVAVLMLFSPLLFEFVFGVAFRESALIFNIYLLLTLTQLIFPQAILTARGDTKILWWISLFELAVNVGSSLFLMREFGLIGIVCGTLIAFVVEKIILLQVVYKRYKIPVVALFNPGTLLLYTILLSITFISSLWIFGI
jgi:O-antigen/teichoic acid export membrane protein